MSTVDLRARLKNVHAYPTTPFNHANLSELDEDGLRRNLEFLVHHGVRVINAGGGTAEVEALSPEELVMLVRTTFQVTAFHMTEGRSLVLPTLPGNLAVALDLIPRYEELGAEVLLAMPPFIRNQVPGDLEGVANYLETLGAATRLPLIPYNTQGWPLEFFERLSEIDSIIAIKDPMHQPHVLFRAISRLGDRFVWIGNKRYDPAVLHYRYMSGIEGFTAGIINFAPAFELDLHEAALASDWPRMEKIQLGLAGLDRLRTAYGDAVIKTGLDLVGLAGGRMRPPRLDLPQAVRDQVRSELLQLELEVIA
ncbi:MAG: dihydrodipicolinate synthase family protein [Trueperaceae bacterium]